MIAINGRRRNAFIDALLNHPNGLTVRECMSFIYADDVNGGPDNDNIIPVMAKQINRLIVAQGWKITAVGGPGSVYRIARA